MGSKRLRRICLLSFLLLLFIIAVWNIDLIRSVISSGRAEQTANEQQQATQQDYIAEDGKVIGADLSAFMYDQNFFDSAQTPTEGADTEQENMLSLQVTSVEKDLRIKIVDIGGEPVTGYPFTILLDEETEYQDTDKDGLIYVQDLKPGRYQVALEEIEGFQVPEHTLEARVKAIVSYTLIDDISYLVHDESEIDASKEDTAQEEIEEADIDDTQYTSLLEKEDLETAVQLGIDVSKWNGKIDWKLVKAEGVDFAIIRCGYRGSSSGWLIEDPYFFQNLQGAKEAGVKVGIYFFTQAMNAVEAVEEASMVISLLAGESIEYPVFIDTEGAGGNGRADTLDATVRTVVCSAFCRTIENAGYTAGIYASRNWFDHNLIVEQLEGYKIWLAEYRHTPLYDKHYDMWQYTSSGSVTGMEGRVDLNVSYLGY